MLSPSWAYVGPSWGYGGANSSNYFWCQTPSLLRQPLLQVRFLLDDHGGVETPTNDRNNGQLIPSQMTLAQFFGPATCGTVQTKCPAFARCLHFAKAADQTSYK